MAFISAFKNTFFLLVLILAACGNLSEKKMLETPSAQLMGNDLSIEAIITGAEQPSLYIPLLEGKRVGVIANQTSVIRLNQNDNSNYIHLVDSLLSAGIDIRKVFAPEHGFRGRADAGEKVEDGLDKKTGLPIVSLYGKNRKPTAEQLEELDIILFDIQDVGVRFYTYIATLQLAMEACAEQDIPILVLDRPNPNGHYVDGPTMEEEHTGFLGLNRIPLVYGMTIGEYAMMINKEGWLEANLKAELKVIPLMNYSHMDQFELPVRPSPNLPNARAVNLYPSLGLFEGTNINAGRGTEQQFQIFGAPFLNKEHFDFSYVPKANFGAKSPKHKDVECFGRDLSDTDAVDAVHLKWLIEAYAHCEDKEKFFNTNNFTRHAGTVRLQQKIEQGLTESEIKAGWKKDLDAFKKIRGKYLMYD